MKNLKLFIAVLFVLTTQDLFSQSIGEWKQVLDTYCERYFEDCFNWDFIEIVSIDDIDYVTDSVVKIQGRVKNTGYFGSEYTRDFKADVSVSSNKITVNFKKQHHTAVQGTYWVNCENSLYK